MQVNEAGDTSCFRVDDGGSTRPHEGVPLGECGLHGTYRPLGMFHSSYSRLLVVPGLPGRQGVYVGDALAMPVHWYYDTNQLRRDFGEILKYEAPKSSFPGSIMNLSNTGGGGRGSDRGSISECKRSHSKGLAVALIVRLIPCSPS